MKKSLSLKFNAVIYLLIICLFRLFAKHDKLNPSSIVLGASILEVISEYEAVSKTFREERKTDRDSEVSRACSLVAVCPIWWFVCVAFESLGTQAHHDLYLITYRSYLGATH